MNASNRLFVNRVVALFYGVTCHLLFFVSVSLMAVSIFFGLHPEYFLARWGLNVPYLGGRSGWLGNVFLVLQFPLLHSWALSKRGQKVIVRFAPLGLGSELRSTLYVIFAAIQILAVFWFWTPSGIILWEPKGLVLYGLSLLYLMSWILLGLSMQQSGLALQTGALGWWAVFCRRKPQYGTFASQGLFAYCRQPIYFSFALILWTAPVWTPDRMLLVLIWTAYSYFGPRFKEARYEGYYGAAYHQYQGRVSYWWPRRKPDQLSEQIVSLN